MASITFISNSTIIVPGSLLVNDDKKAMKDLLASRRQNVRNRKVWIKREPTTILGQRIVSAAVQEFSSKGIAGARVAAICRRAGTTEPSFYRYFDGMRQAALYIMSEYYWAPLNTRVRHYRQISQDPNRVLEAVIEALIQSAEDDPIRPWLSQAHVFRIVVVQMRNPFLLPDAMQDSEYIAFIRELTSVIGTGQNANLFARALTADLLAQSLMITLHGLLMLNSLGGCPAKISVNDVRKVAKILTGLKGTRKLRSR
jgi:AcrR family transcriptional regulator